jgi:hypothetical protein
MTPKEHFIMNLSTNGGNGERQEGRKVGVTVEDLRNITPNTDSPQVQYFSSDVSIKDTSDGPKVGVHAYGNSDEETANRAVLLYIDVIEKVDAIRKEGKHKIRLTADK